LAAFIVGKIYCEEKFECRPKGHVGNGKRTGAEGDKKGIREEFGVLKQREAQRS
jgi:hypothetical protein